MASDDNTEQYKLSGGQVEEDGDVDLDRACCETATQAMLSLLQAVCGARMASTTTQSHQAHSAGTKQPPHLTFPFE